MYNKNSFGYLLRGGESFIHREELDSGFSAGGIDVTPELLRSDLKDRGETLEHFMHWSKLGAVVELVQVPQMQPARSLAG